MGWAEKSGTRGPLSKHSVHAYCRSVRGFLTWCKREGEIVQAQPQLPRLPKKIVDVLDRDEIEALENALTAERDKIIVRMLGDCGLRAGEVCSLRIGDLIRRERNTFLHVRGKGARERLVPVVLPLFRRIERYAKSGRLFVSLRRGRSGFYEPLTPSAVLNVVQNGADRAGIRKRVYSHLLRHSFFTNGLRGGVNPLLLAQIGGHSSLKMLQSVYSHLDVDDAYDAMARLLLKRD